jgi:hypothetical protein
VRWLVFTTIGVLWFSLGMGLIIAPAWTVEIVERVISDEFRLFVLTQSAIIVSLALVVGTTGLHFHGLWIVLGCIGLLKGLFFTWAPIGRREAVLDWALKRPFWEYRVSGIILVALATMLAHAISVL